MAKKVEAATNSNLVLLDRIDVKKVWKFRYQPELGSPAIDQKSGLAYINFDFRELKKNDQKFSSTVCHRDQQLPLLLLSLARSTSDMRGA